MPRTAYNLRNESLTTWLPEKHVERFRAIAKARGVSPAAFLRALVVDAIEDEASGFSLYLSPSGEAIYHPHPK